MIICYSEMDIFVLANFSGQEYVWKKRFSYRDFPFPKTSEMKQT